MQITTWNVNGLRAVFRKESWDWVAETQMDVIGLQEIKSREDQLTKAQQALFTETNTVWNPAERPGYSGTLTMSKTAPKESVRGFGIEKFDAEGRVVQSVFDDFRLFNIYFPNGQRDQERLDFKLEFYAELLNYVDELHKKGENVIIMGDFNTAHNEIDLARPKQNEKTSGFLRIERDWVDKYEEHGLVDAFRTLYPEKVGYSWWSYRAQARERNVGWRLDYFMVSKALMPRIKDVVIHDDVTGSDHCPVSLFID